MSAAATTTRTREPLHWRKPDAYHIRTACGRFTVARVTAEGVDHYIAWRIEVTGKDANGFDIVRSTEIASRVVTPRSTDEERLNAIKAMQRVCEDAA